MNSLIRRLYLWVLEREIKQYKKEKREAILKGYSHGSLEAVWKAYDFFIEEKTKEIKIVQESHNVKDS